MDYTPTLSPRFVTYVRDYLLAHEVDPTSVFNSVDFEFEVSEEFARPVDANKVCGMMTKAAKLTNNPTMGIDMAIGYRYEVTSILILAMMSAKNVQAGLETLHHYIRYIDAAIDIHLKKTKDYMEFRFEVLIQDTEAAQQLNEYLTVFLYTTLEIATRKTPLFNEVWVKHQDQSNSERLAEIFGKPVKYGNEINGFQFKAEYLDAPFLSQNYLIHQLTTDGMTAYLKPFSKTNRLVDKVARELMQVESPEEMTLDFMAGKFSTSGRTLRRRLADEGFSFKEAVQMAREHKARHYLVHSNLSLTEIAYKLNFSELSAFSRAFRRWVGVAPQTFRETAKRAFVG